MLWQYWGKADPAFAGRHHAAVLHSLDVAACAWVLLERDSALRDKIAAAVPCTNAVATTAFFCALHDVGKFDARFQIKAPETAERLQPGVTSLPRTPYDHGGEGYRQLYADLELLDVVGRGGDALLQAVCGHHGTIPQREGIARDLPRAVEAQDKKARSALMGEVSGLFSKRGAATHLTKVNPGAQQLVAGVCAIADWVGSNTEWFPYEEGPVDLEAWFAQALTRAQDAVEAAGLAPRAVHATTFTSLFPGLTPRGVQTLTEAIETDEPALIVVEAEMGQGKTEAALSLAARFLRDGHASGVFIGLPTMATSNAIFARVDSLVSRLLATSSDRPAHVALAHGQARKNALFQQRFRERSLQSARYDDEAGVVCARWLLGRKRALLAQVGVGTIDQALQAVLLVHHQFVRLTALARDVVIVDEVHAYDAYMESLLEHAVRWWGALRVPVILLSATLPAERRARLVDAWRGTAETPIDDGVAATETPYPAVTVARSSSAPQLRSLSPADQTTSRHVTLDLRRASRDDDLESVVDELVAAASKGARVAWIRNTVGDAQNGWRLLRKSAERAGVAARLFHARFRQVDRRRIETDVLSNFGKLAPEGGRIVLATQVIEQSLDLDFDWMVSDLAPIDLLLQRMGRLHRHHRERIDAWKKPTLTVRIGSDVDAEAVSFGDSAYVYDGPTLWLAREALRKHEERGLVVPGDIRPLVEASYHPVMRDEALTTQRLRELEDERRKDATVRASNAMRVVIAAADNRSLGTTVDDDDDTVQALTRDGRSTTILPVLWRDGVASTLEGAALELNPASPFAYKTLDLLDEQRLTYSTPAPVHVVTPPGDATAWDAFASRFAHFVGASALGRVVLLGLREVASANDGAVFRGALRVGQRRRAVLYSRSLGLHLVKGNL